MISFTLETALAVRLIGAAFFVTSGTVVVAIRISLALKLFDYSRSHFLAILKIFRLNRIHLINWMPECARRSHC